MHGHTMHGQHPADGGTGQPVLLSLDTRQHCDRSVRIWLSALSSLIGHFVAQEVNYQIVPEKTCKGRICPGFSS
jgi:hypothetical protein